VIERTVLLVDRLDADEERELERRHARRNRLRLLDELLDRFEQLNLREATSTPRRLARRTYGLVQQEHHPLLRRPLHQITIADWMDALYDLQDPLLLGGEDDDAE
jgi:hypothetical protein